jgi:hypothetical protein
MALTEIISTLLPSFATDDVAVFTQDFTQVFAKARALKATVKESAKLMEHPVESGAIITDHRIILPVEIELSLILASSDYQNVYKQIRSFYLNSTFLTVQTRAGIYYNQIIESMPHEEDPSYYDVLTLALNLKQVQIVTAQFGVQTKNPSNGNTTRRGTQQGTPATPKQTTSALGGITGLSA